MREFLKTLRAQVMVSALFSILLGLAFIIWPLKITSIICRVMALLILVMGAGQLIRYSNHRKSVSGIAGILEVLIGLWIFVKPVYIVELIPVIIGIILLIHGIQDASMAMESKNSGSTNWWFGMLCAVLNIVFAVILICDSVGVVQVGMMFIGFILLYDGLSDLIVAIRVNQKIK